MVEASRLIHARSDRWQCDQRESNGIKSKVFGPVIQFHFSGPKDDDRQKQLVTGTDFDESVVVVGAGTESLPSVCISVSAK